MTVETNRTSCQEPEIASPEANVGRPAPSMARYLLMGAAAVGVWYAVYSNLEPAANWLTYSLLGLSEGTHLALQRI